MSDRTTVAQYIIMCFCIHIALDEVAEQWFYRNDIVLAYEVWEINFWIVTHCSIRFRELSDLIPSEDRIRWHDKWSVGVNEGSKGTMFPVVPLQTVLLLGINSF